MSAMAALLADGRLHLQHGPIDCVCQVWGEPAEVRAAYRQAAGFFDGVLAGLCAELAVLRAPLPALLPNGGMPNGGTPNGASPNAASPNAASPTGAVARAMIQACLPFAARFITPMAAVAGAVADAVLAAMVAQRRVSRAFVNNGGDIGFFLAPGETLRCGLVTDLAIPALDGAFVLDSARPARGVATSGRACKGRKGRSFSFGIADSVTVLARTAAQADAAATVIGNAVDLPGHPAVDRQPARSIDPDSDLGDRLITFDVGPLSAHAIGAALDAGALMAEKLLRAGLIDGAVLALRGELRVLQPALELA